MDEGEPAGPQIAWDEIDPALVADAAGAFVLGGAFKAGPADVDEQQQSEDDSSSEQESIFDCDEEDEDAILARIETEYEESEAVLETHTRLDQGKLGEPKSLSGTEYNGKLYAMLRRAFGDDLVNAHEQASRADVAKRQSEDASQREEAKQEEDQAEAEEDVLFSPLAGLLMSSFERFNEPFPGCRAANGSRDFFHALDLAYPVIYKSQERVVHGERDAWTTQKLFHKGALGGKIFISDRWQIRAEADAQSKSKKKKPDDEQDSDSDVDEGKEAEVNLQDDEHDHSPDPKHLRLPKCVCKEIFPKMDQYRMDIDVDRLRRPSRDVACSVCRKESYDESLAGLQRLHPGQYEHVKLSLGLQAPAIPEEGILQPVPVTVEVHCILRLEKGKRVELCNVTELVCHPSYGKFLFGAANTDDSFGAGFAMESAVNGILVASGVEMDEEQESLYLASFMPKYDATQDGMFAGVHIYCNRKVAKERRLLADDCNPEIKRSAPYAWEELRFGLQEYIRLVIQLDHTSVPPGESILEAAVKQHGANVVAILEKRMVQLEDGSWVNGLKARGSKSAKTRMAIITRDDGTETSIAKQAGAKSAQTRTAIIPGTETSIALQAAAKTLLTRMKNLANRYASNIAKIKEDALSTFILPSNSDTLIDAWAARYAKSKSTQRGDLLLASGSEQLLDTFERWRIQANRRRTEVSEATDLVLGADSLQLAELMHRQCRSCERHKEVCDQVATGCSSCLRNKRNCSYRTANGANLTVLLKGKAIDSTTPVCQQKCKNCSGRRDRGIPASDCDRSLKGCATCRANGRTCTYVRVVQGVEERVTVWKDGEVTDADVSSFQWTPNQRG